MTDNDEINWSHCRELPNPISYQCQSTNAQTLAIIYARQPYNAFMSLSLHAKHSLSDNNNMDTYMNIHAYILTYISNSPSVN